MDLKSRIFGAGHRVFTILGVVAGALVAASEYLDLIPAEYRTSKWYALAAGLVAVGAWWKKNMAPAPVAEVPAAVLTKAPKGYASLRLLLALTIALGILASLPARAQEVQPGGLLPQAGACFRDGGICVQPAATVIPVLIDFRSGNVSHDVAFGFGYAITFPKALTPSLVPGADFLGGTQTGGGWNAAFLLRLGALRFGPVVTHKPGATYAGLGVGTGM